MPKIASIGLPFHKITNELFVALESILVQPAISDCQLVLAGDGASVEPLLDYVRRRGLMPGQITAIESPASRGLASTLNAITSESQAPYIVRFDSDDIMLDDRISIQLNYMERRPEIDVSGTLACLMDEHSEILGEFSEPPLPAEPVGFLRSNALSHPTVIARSEWMRANPYDESLRRTEDKELWLRTCRTSTFGKLGIRTVAYRVPRNIDISKSVETFRDDRTILKAAIESGEFPGVRKSSVMVRSRMRETIFKTGMRLGGGPAIFTKKYTQIEPEELRSTQAYVDQIVATTIDVVKSAQAGTSRD
ncbi:glycosyltransferase [Gordonia sp. NPDC003376]